MTGKRPTLMDVAEAAGVSRALVSIVMRDAPGASEATRRKVQEAARLLGYRPDSRARLLRSSRTRLLGVTFSTSHAFHAEIVDAAYAAAGQRGYELALSAVTRDRTENHAVEALVDLGCEALIMISPTLDEQELAGFAARLPVVSLLRDDVGESLDSVSSDDREGIRIALGHLTSLGHTRIAHVDGGSMVSGPQRREAYLAEMAGLGLEPRVIPGGPTEEDGIRAGRELQDNLPTAVLAFNDRCALGILESLRASGLRVPQDVSVLGYDDSQFARLSYIRLSSISQDAPLLAGAAVDRAIQRLESTTPAAHLVRIPHLVVRGTTGPVPSGGTR
ncbi:MAG: LacI family DNA-binding transcriptional regulator [Paenarthrobacter ureafaciens]|uniref:LacI family DNA-binding transcriptional regulator n=1 Tax=Paenarthrobacter ureafaciens TaxID=37931 RepID=UPI001AC87462|nr:LacI family DNA-binding transcriptional regulator [Paenarthrobacter ureafaciens]MBN9128147.1 LacI family DNA-binding transcriptional regulator [Paenarthrobacter ureafaciens]